MIIEVKEVKPGKYQHYKGKTYEVLGIGRHSETLQEFIVYRALYNSPEFGNNAIWIRPKEMFFEIVDYNGKKLPRFKLVD